MKPKSKILIIAGSDSSGGAGIQADIKTLTSLGSYAMTAITAVTVQNTKGVKSVIPIPENEIRKCIKSSRIFLLIWLSIIIFSIYLQSLLPIFLFLIPNFFRSFNALWGMTQHTGLKGNVKDHRVTTRSVRLNPIFSFIYWKMEYHVEHHMFPMIPSYNLPKLHEVIKDQLPAPKTLYTAYKDMITAVIKRKKDPSYCIPVELPNS